MNKFACSFVSNLEGSELKGGLVAHDHHTQLLRQSTLFQSLHQKKKRKEATTPLDVDSRSQVSCWAAQEACIMRVMCSRAQPAAVNTARMQCSNESSPDE